MFSRAATSIFTAALLLAAILVSGCTTLPISGTMAERIAITKLAAVEQGAPFAASADGTKVAYLDKKLIVFDLTRGEKRTLGAQRPSALAWAPDGTMLVTAFPKGNQSTLRVMDQNGMPARETVVDGHVTQLTWTAKEILAGAVMIDPFTFGANVRGMLYRWPDNAKPAAIVLSDTTVRPFVSRWPREMIYRTFTFNPSPHGGEVVYTRLQDPPKFTPYLKIMIRNLDSGLDKEVASVAIGSAPPIYTANGEQIIFGNGETSTDVIDPWTGKTITTVKGAGRFLAVSPGGSHILADGRLYRDGTAVASVPAASRGEFMPDGKLLVSYDGILYLLSGLQDTPVITLPKEKQEQLNALHKWRSEGLISVPEFESARERIYR